MLKWTSAAASRNVSTLDISVSFFVSEKCSAFYKFQSAYVYVYIHSYIPFVRFKLIETEDVASAPVVTKTYNVSPKRSKRINLFTV